MVPPTTPPTILGRRPHRGHKAVPIGRWDGEALNLVATHNTPPAYAEFRRRTPFRADQKNPVGHMTSTKTVVQVADLAAEQTYVEHDPGAEAAFQLGGLRTFLAVPMLKENELVGAFVVSRVEARPFTNKQIELVTAFAAQAVIAIENARLLRELRESLQEQTVTDNKTISKWARALRYVAHCNVRPSELKTFMKEAGGVNGCGDRYAKYLGRCAR
jgi:GAF domain-containing protein